jgi:hypothetical protein
VRRAAVRARGHIVTLTLISIRVHKVVCLTSNAIPIIVFLPEHGIDVSGWRERRVTLETGI